MGGGAAAVIRSTAKVGLGLGAIGGYRGIPSSPVPLADRVLNARNSALPISSSSSSSSSFDVSEQQQIKNSSLTSSSSWAINEWDFISEHYHDDGEAAAILDLMEEPSSSYRYGFDTVPSYEEAKSATCDLKHALEKLHFSTTGGAGSGFVRGGYYDSSTTTFAGSGYLPKPLEAYFSSAKTRSFATSEPKNAFLAFSMLQDSPDVQNVVASLASDKNVWEAVMKNEELMEFYKKANKNVGEVSTPGVGVQRTPIGDMSILSAANGLIGLMDIIKEKVLAMVSSVLEYIQNIFRDPAEGREGKEGREFANAIWKYGSTSAPFMALTIAAIMVVMVKRA